MKAFFDERNKSRRFHPKLLLKFIGKIFISAQFINLSFFAQISQGIDNINKNKCLSSESIRDKLEQMKNGIENNIGGEMREMKERLDTLMATLEENKDEGQL